jgi:hypothetical protein
MFTARRAASVPRRRADDPSDRSILPVADAIADDECEFTDAENEPAPAGPASTTLSSTAFVIERLKSDLPSIAGGETIHAVLCRYMLVFSAAGAVATAASEANAATFGNPDEPRRCAGR